MFGLGGCEIDGVPHLTIWHRVLTNCVSSLSLDTRSFATTDGRSTTSGVLMPTVELVDAVRHLKPSAVLSWLNVAASWRSGHLLVGKETKLRPYQNDPLANSEQMYGCSTKTIGLV